MAPTSVDGAWRLLSGPCTVSAAESRVVAALLDEARVDDDDAVAWADRELKLIEAAERVKAWVDSQALSALARLREAVEDRVQALADARAWTTPPLTRLAAEALVGSDSHDPDDSGDSLDVVGAKSRRALVERMVFRAQESALDVRHETDTAKVDEVMLATGLPEGEVRRRLALADNNDGRGSVLIIALATGETSLFRATTIHQQTAQLDVQVARAVSARLVGRAPDGSVRSHRWFTQQLRRQVTRHTDNPTAARSEVLLARRVYATVDDDGSATLVATGDVSRVTAAMDRVQRIALRLRSGGDARTLEQLRSDITIDLILYGWVSRTDGKASLTSRARGSAGATEALAINGVQGGQELALFSRLHADHPLDVGPTTFVGAAPPAHVTVVISLASLLGVDDAPGQMPGWARSPRAKPGSPPWHTGRSGRDW